MQSWIPHIGVIGSMYYTPPVVTLKHFPHIQHAHIYLKTCRAKNTERIHTAKSSTAIKLCKGHNTIVMISDLGIKGIIYFVSWVFWLCKWRKYTFVLFYWKIITMAQLSVGEYNPYSSVCTRADSLEHEYMIKCSLIVPVSNKGLHRLVKLSIVWA